MASIYDVTSTKSQVGKKSSDPSDENLVAAVDTLAMSFIDEPYRKKADVVLPPDKSLEIPLVRRDDLSRFLELNSDEAIISAATFTVLGAVFGTLTNVATSGEGKINQLTWVVLIALSVMLISLTLFWGRHAVRVSRLKRKLLGDNPNA